jgi:hypothetical protein
MNPQSLGVVLASGNVIRCHTLPTIKQQTVGAHTWRAMVILHWLYAPGYPPPSLTHALLVHDVPEVWTGDMPGDVKHADRVLAAAMERMEDSFFLEHGIPNGISAGDQMVVALCDRADLVMYALDEVDMGNRTMLQIARKAFEMAQGVRDKVFVNNTIDERVDLLMHGMSQRLLGLELKEGTWPNW